MNDDPPVTGIFDTHFHLEPDDDIAALVAGATAAGVSEMMVAGAAPPFLRTMLARIQPYPEVYAAVGVHPHSAETFDGDIAPYRELAADPSVCAVGEVGLDYFYDNAPRAVQQQTFAAFIALADELQQPLIVHCRDAWDDCAELLASRQTEVPFVIHCFTGTAAWAERFLAMGAYLSFNGILTFKRSEALRAVFRELPGDRVFFETDSPYLAPVPLRGRRNEPANMPHIIRCAAALLELDPQALADRSTAAARQFYGLAGGDA
jgi:TatD DNase family protein